MAASGLMLKPAPAEDFQAFASRHRVDALVVMRKPNQLPVAPSGADGSAAPVEVLDLETIASVNMRIPILTGFYLKQKRLVDRERELTQEEHGIKGCGFALDEVLRLFDLINITVKAAQGDQHVFQVRRTGKVRDLKKRISDKNGGLPLEHQLLSLRGEELEDGTNIEDLSLEGDAVLHLSVQKRANLWTSLVGRDVELVIAASEEDLRENATNCTRDLSSKVDAPSRFLRVDGSAHLVRTNAKKEDRQVRGSNNIVQDFQRHSSLEPARHTLRFDIPGTLKEILGQVRAGLNAGRAPVLSSEGSGGVYFMRDECGLQNVAVFKPMDEEPLAINNPRGFSSLSCGGEGFKKGTRIGGGAIREVAAYLLDHPASGPRRGSARDQEGFAGVPPTMLVRCHHEAFSYSSKDQKLYSKSKVGSLQQFVRAFSSCEDMGPSSFPVEEVHKITVLDLRLANADRNGGNILVCRRENQSLKLVPIDHGYCLPEKFEDCTFEWLYWPQARRPYGPDTLKYIASLDSEKDISLLQQCGWALRSQSALILRVSTMLLKKGAIAGLTPFQIGSILSRSESLDTPSPIELILEQAEALRLPSSTEQQFFQILSGLLDKHIALLKPL